MKRWTLLTAVVCTVLGIHSPSIGARSSSGTESRARQYPVAPLPAQLATLVKAALDTQAGDHHGWEQAEAFYAKRGFQPAWWSEGRREAGRVLIERMEAAAADGLSPAHYRAGAMKAHLADPPGALADAVTSDVHVTASLLRFATDLAYGIGGTESDREIDVLQLIEQARDPRSARDVIALLEPPHSEYRQLRQALRQYRELEERGGWPSLPEDTLLRREEQEAETKEEGSAPADPAALEKASAVVTALCERLAVTGDLHSGTGTQDPCGVDGGEPVYDETLEAAVRAFQARHGLQTDGIVGPRTVAALNVPVNDRITQIALNMNRWRRLPADLGNPHVLVNVAGFSLRVGDGRRTALRMRVVAGEPETPTPVMSDEISYLEFRPYWNVPRSITENELLPKILENRAYLQQQRFQVVDGWSEPAEVVNPSSIDWHAVADDFPYRLRQLPGPENSLGLVKFMFPNDYSVYLHDTPATHRFEARRRAFSHGCVRVEDPVALAEFLLRDNADQYWSREAITSAMYGGERQVVRLEKPVPVHLTYFTAWAQDGEVQFRADLYGRDEQERGAITTTSD